MYMPEQFIPLRANILGVGIHALDVDKAVALIDSALAEGRKGIVCATGVHGITEARKDPTFRAVLNNAFLNIPDSRPTFWVGRLEGFDQIAHIGGPRLMLRVCEMSVQRGYTHFLYGGNVGVAQELRETLARKFPGIKITGTYTPPFGPLTGDEEAELLQLVSQQKPNICWVGLSTPKQERFMAEYLRKLDTTVMIGVGAAFDFHTGRVKDAPQWMKTAGLAWLHRLGQEPRRLWKRYLSANTRFLCEIMLQLLRLRTYHLEVPHAASNKWQTTQQGHEE
jgi:N-acetylglucosaminyldiphosphoundecaprenol N-acetyl-beta-D-mannosaminyltransferase